MEELDFGEINSKSNWVTNVETCAEPCDSELDDGLYNLCPFATSS
jgi:hypothetical protein